MKVRWHNVIASVLLHFNFQDNFVAIKNAGFVSLLSIQAQFAHDAQTNLRLRGRKLT